MSTLLFNFNEMTVKVSIFIIIYSNIATKQLIGNLCLCNTNIYRLRNSSIFGTKLTDKIKKVWYNF